MFWVALLPFATQPRIPQHWRPRYPHQGDLGELTVCGLQLHPISLAPIILDASYICRRSSIHSRSIVHLPHSVAYNALVPTYTPAALRHSRSLVGEHGPVMGCGSSHITIHQASYPRIQADEVVFMVPPRTRRTVDKCTGRSLMLLSWPTIAAYNVAQTEFITPFICGPPLPGRLNGRIEPSHMDPSPQVLGIRHLQWRIHVVTSSPTSNPIYSWCAMCPIRASTKTAIQV